MACLSCDDARVAVQGMRLPHAHLRHQPPQCRQPQAHGPRRLADQREARVALRRQEGRLRQGHHLHAARQSHIEAAQRALTQLLSARVVADVYNYLPGGGRLCPRTGATWELSASR